jgi:transcriptional regulator with XRE-family HTH domain
MERGDSEFTMDGDEKLIGERLRALRAEQGVSLAKLAERTGLSKGYLSRAERGLRSLDRRSTVQTIADSLQVPVTALTGQPYPARTPEDVRTRAAVLDIRDALQGVEFGERPDVEVRPLPVLEREVRRVCVLRLASDFAGYGPLVPSLITALHAVVADADEGLRRQALPLLVDVYYSAHWLTKSRGYHDLSWLTVERALEAAEATGDPSLLGVTHLLRSLALMPVGKQARGRALTIARRAADDLQPYAQAGTAAEMYGMLHLASAFASTVGGRLADGEDHLREAERTAERTGEGRAWDFWFGPTNVAVWRIGITAEAGDDGKVGELARGIDISAIPSPSRRASFFGEVGRAYARQRRMRAQAVGLIRKAEGLAPQWVRNDPLLRETVGELRTTVGGREVRELAGRMGLEG